MKHISKYMNKAFVMVAIACIAFIAASCEHKELFMQQPQKQMVKIAFDWSNLRVGDSKPEGMSLYFYSDRTKEMVKYDISTATDENMIEIYSGIYDLICYNNDSPAIASRFTESLKEHDILAMELNNQTPTMYGYNCDVDILYEEEGYNGPVQVITISPKRINSSYIIMVHNIDAVSNAIKWSASLSGLTNSIYASSRKCSENASESVITFPLSESKVNNMCTNTIITFGQMFNSKDRPLNKLFITALTSDKTVVYYLFNVTPQIENAIDKNNIIISVDLENATPLQPGDPDYPSDAPDYVEGGINAGVDEFPNENIDIIVK